MKRSHALALSGIAVFLALSNSSHAQAVRPGQQCQPAVANASMYGNCRLRIVRGQEACRCAILPQALRQLGRSDRDAMTILNDVLRRLELRWTIHVRNQFTQPCSRRRHDCSHTGSDPGNSPAAGSVSGRACTRGTSATSASGGSRRRPYWRRKFRRRWRHSCRQQWQHRQRQHWGLQRRWRKCKRSK